jgi:cytochrome c heme-lyase
MSEESACPVNYPGKKSKSSPLPASPLTSSTSPVNAPASKSPSGESACPVNHGALAGAAEDKVEYGASINDMVFGQDRQKDQRIDLSTKRIISTIPKNEFTPDHQPKGEDKWMYPSEQQYYNAIKRKGYTAKEEDIPVIVAIHNTVNEQGWGMIREWELFRGNTNPKLTRFMGRPQDISPKAYLLNFFFGYKLPFDRHDWIIDRNGKDVRYVIDFYTGDRNEALGKGRPVSMHLDVRPALDSPGALVDRVMHFFRSNFMPWKMPLNRTSGTGGNSSSSSSNKK